MESELLLDEGDWAKWGSDGKAKIYHNWEQAAKHAPKSYPAVVIWTYEHDDRYAPARNFIDHEFVYPQDFEAQTVSA